MDFEEFKVRGKEMVEYISDYLQNIETRRVTPSVEPGYLKNLLPNEAPEEGESWDAIMQDVETKIMPGVTHWSHPRFHAYFPAGNSFPSILGEMLSSGIGCIGFSWAASPACTELETIVVDWFGKAIGLPDDFLAFKGKGGGVIQTSASECVLVTMLAARAQGLKRLKQQHPFVEEGVLLSKLIAYCSKEAHSCVEKAAMICFVKLRILEPDEKSSLTGPRLLSAMEEDESMGFIPFFVSTTLGTTSCCSFDDLKEIGPVCKKFPCVWLHVDAAYAGNSFICPELKYLLAGIEYADSFNTNPNKWLLTNFDCSTMWVRDRIRLTSALVVDPLYLQHGYSDSTIDYRHWGVPLSRRFRSLKLWFVMRNFGISGLQNYIRHHIKLAKLFESRVLNDRRFEVCNEVKYGHRQEDSVDRKEQAEFEQKTRRSLWRNTYFELTARHIDMVRPGKVISMRRALGLVCFRLRGSDKLNEKLLSTINASGKLHMVPANVNEKYVIRFCAVAQNATEEDIDYAWQIITEYATELLETQALEKEQETSDKVTDMDRRKQYTLAQKRSFFVRMVSDPKIYNPSITKGVATRRHLTEGSPENVTVHAPATSSWISWPIAFLLQGMGDDSNSSNVPIRFRHLDTKMRLNTGKRDGQSPSPERETSRSPKRSPDVRRKSSITIPESKQT